MTARKRAPAPPDAGPAIVLLGAMLGPGGAPGPALLRRTDHAAALFAAGSARLIVATGGPPGARPTEARVMRDRLVAAGIDPAAVVEEDRARDTLENALFASRILRARGLASAIVVTDRYHLPRALMLFWLLGLRAAGSAPSRGARVDPGGRPAALAREAVALPRDLLRGLAARRLR
jgi:uncharacterized SAM-binding protein YcdF (DUF218 family)